VNVQKLIKYSINKDIYFIVDPNGNPRINPGLFAPFIKGSVVEIKTIHKHYKLYMSSVSNKALKNNELEEVLKLIPNIKPDSGIYPFLSDDKPTPYIKGGKFVPDKEK